MLVDGLWMLFGGAFVAGAVSKDVSRFIASSVSEERRCIVNEVFVDVQLEYDFEDMVRDPDQYEHVYNILEEYKANGGAFSRYPYFRDLWSEIGNKRRQLFPEAAYQKHGGWAEMLRENKSFLVSLLMQTENKMSLLGRTRDLSSDGKKSPMYIPVQYYPTVLRDMILDHPDPKYARENPVWALSSEHVLILQQDVDEAFAILEGRQKKRPIPTTSDYYIPKRY